MNAADLLELTDSGSAVTVVEPQALLENVAHAGWDFIDVGGVLASPGKLHYVVYDTAPGATPTAQEIRDAVVGGAITHAGSVDVVSGETLVKTTLTGLNPGSTYEVYWIGENSQGELMDDAEVVHQTKTTAVRHEQFTFDSPAGLVDTGFTTTIGYYLYLPKAYYRDPTKKLPVLIFLHGAGEASNVNDLPNFNLLKLHGPPKHIENGTWDEDLPFIVISPQLWNRNNPQWRNTTEGLALMDEVLADVQANHPNRLDADRLYLTGLSLGGNGVIHYITSTVARRNSVAAMIPVAAWYGTSLTTSTQSIPCVAKEVPIWAFHGDADGTVTIDNMRKQINLRINDTATCGSPAPSPLGLLTEFPGGGHNSWSTTYANTHGASNTGGDGTVYSNIYEWLLSFRRNINVPSLDVTGADTRIQVRANVPDPGTVYYAVFDSAQGVLSAAQVQAAATSGGPGVVKYGTMTIGTGDINAEQVARLSGFEAGQTYFTYVLYVDDSANETQDDFSTAL